MRIIYAITDMHVEIDAMKTAGKLIKKYGAEVCLCCGDYSWFGQGSKESLKILNDYSVKTYIIHGNHEMLNTAKNDIKDFKNLIFIHKKSVIFKDFHWMTGRESELRFSIKDAVYVALGVITQSA